MRSVAGLCGALVAAAALAGAAPATQSPLVGRWERVTTCRQIVDALAGVGLRLAAPSVLAANGLVPGDRWCVTARNWLRAHLDGAAAHVVLASTHERVLQIVPLDALREHAVDVPDDISDLL